VSDAPGVTPPWWRHADPDRFGPVLALLIASLVVGAALPTRLAGLAAAVLGIVLWLAVARAADLGRPLRLAGAAALSVVSAVAAATTAADSWRARSVVDLVLAAAVAVIAAVIARSLMRERVVTLSTVAGVLSLYLLIGLFFAQAYMGVAGFDDGAFASARSLGRFDLLYFSFVTLTTVGFGDITPTIDLTRALAASEAVLGQLFLVTVVARVISLLGRPRPG